MSAIALMAPFRSFGETKASSSVIAQNMSAASSTTYHINMLRSILISRSDPRPHFSLKSRIRENTMQKASVAI